jgi:hypothetical protein
MLKIKFNIAPEKLADNLLNDVKATAPKIVEAFSSEVEVNARRNFDKALLEISGDNPYITVQRTVSGDTATISCSGEQVLFAEFGAGIHNTYREKEVYVESHFAISRSNTLYYVEGHYKTIGLRARGFTDNGMTENMPRPAGIVELGHYGKGLGMLEWWVRPSTNMQKALGESNVHKKNGEIKQGVLWTQGTKPVRGLWRARNTAINKLLSGRLKLK